MQIPDVLQRKMYNLTDLLREVARLKLLKKTISFTNGCFDILHEGHIASLLQASNEGNFLIVGLNSDSSVKRLKGSNRPVNAESSRLIMMASLLMVDAVILFEEDTPLNLIKSIMPHVIVKGGDYTVEQIEGSKEVLANGGRVVINPIVQGFSTTALIEKLKNQ